jgi:hypothetical protein
MPKISIEELQKMLPEGNVFALDREVPYLMVCDHKGVALKNVGEMLNAFKSVGINMAVLVVADVEKSVKIFEVVETRASEKQ